MRIGILGAGQMAAALAPHWVAAGHDIVIGARSPGRAAALAGELGVRAGTLAAAAAHGEAVLVAITYAGAEEAVRGVAGALSGTALIDCTNPVVGGATGPVLATGRGPSAAERLAAAVPEAYVVKAFNLCADPVWRNPPAGLNVPLCVDEPTALARAERLIKDTGCGPLPAGGVERAGYLEATAAFAIGAWFSGGDPRTAFPPLERSGH